MLRRERRIVGSWWNFWKKPKKRPGLSILPETEIKE
jgi:hypothetical protein